MKKTITISIIILFVTLLYTALFPVKLSRYSLYKLAYYFDTASSSKTDAIDGYFIEDHKKCGYFHSKNGIVSAYQAAEKEFIDANIFGYIAFEKVGETIRFYSPSGEEYKKITNFGYPYLVENRPYVFVLTTNGVGLSMYNIKGESAFENLKFNSLITSISVDENGRALVSTLEGKTYLLDYDGKIKQIYENSGSRIQMAKSNALSKMGEFAAVTSGLYPEYIDIYESESHSKIHQIKTDTNYQYSSFLSFFENRLYYESAGELKYIDPESKTEGTFTYQGEIKESIFAENGNILILTEDQSLNYLYLYTPTGIKLYYKEFYENASNLKFLSNNSFYFKLGNQIVTFNDINS